MRWLMRVNELLDKLNINLAARNRKFDPKCEWGVFYQVLNFGPVSGVNF